MTYGLTKPNVDLDQEALLSTVDAAQFLGLSEIYIRKLRYDRDPAGPPFIMIGRRVMYRPSDLKTWLDAKVVDPATAFPPRKVRKRKVEATT